MSEAAPAPALAAEPGGFQASRAMGHLRGLVQIGPRVMGSEGAATARAYVRRHLEALGLTVEARDGKLQRADAVALSVVNLSAMIAPAPGESGQGELVLATPLDTAPTETFELLGANEGASGAAVLLELARVLSHEPLPYAVRVLFLDGEVFAPRRHLGSELAWVTLRERDVRLLVHLHQVGDADLAIHRDLFSQRIFRDAFFRVAKELGHEAAFPAAAGFDQVPGGHRVFFRRGMRHIVALSDIRYGGDEPPGDHWRTAEDDLDNVSEESLGIVGAVVLASLRDVSTHLQRVDAHTRRRVVADQDVPEAAEAAEAADGSPGEPEADARELGEEPTQEAADEVGGDRPGSDAQAAEAQDSESGAAAADAGSTAEDTGNTGESAPAPDDSEPSANDGH